MENSKVCFKCGGWCCKYIVLGSITELKQIEYWKARAIETIELSNYKYSFVIPQRCKFLGTDDKCSIYKKRPYVCEVFPRNIEYNKTLSEKCELIKLKKKKGEYTDVHRLKIR